LPYVCVFNLGGYVYRPSGKLMAIWQNYKYIKCIFIDKNKSFAKKIACTKNIKSPEEAFS
jgi:hypothetical protein